MLAMQRKIVLFPAKKRASIVNSERTDRLISMESHYEFARTTSGPTKKQYHFPWLKDEINVVDNGGILCIVTEFSRRGQSFDLSPPPEHGTRRPNRFNVLLGPPGTRIFHFIVRFLIRILIKVVGDSVLDIAEAQIQKGKFCLQFFFIFLDAFNQAMIHYGVFFQG